MTPDNFTNQETFIDVSDSHKIYVHDWGNKKAMLTILHLHGGPGAGSSDKDKVKFDPMQHRVIFFDQRGAGKSLPYGELNNNTTQNLAKDINKILAKLKINKVLLLGSSWGSTMALYYAIRSPDKVKGLIIDGIFTASTEEINWQTSGAINTFYPDKWQNFIESVPKKFKTSPYEYYLKKSSDNDSIYQIMKLQSSILKLDDEYTMPNIIDFDEIPGSIELHYLKNNFFLNPNYLLENAHKIKVPVYIIQGRYDMVCPPIAAYKLHNKLPKSKLIWTINGHIRSHEAKTLQKILLENFTHNV